MVMKMVLPLLSILLLCNSCKKDPGDPILPDEPTPDLKVFEGQIGANDNSTIATPDNALLICGYNGNDLFVIKTSKEGALIWRKDIYANGAGKAYGITQIENEDIFICGLTYRNEDVTGEDVILMKLNPAGDTIWTKTYGGLDDDIGRSIINTQDGNLLICGSTLSLSPFFSQHVYLIKLNYNGDTLWTRTIQELQGAYPFHVMQTKNGEYLVTGRASDSSSKPALFLLKLNEDGTVRWIKTKGNGIEQWGMSSIEDANGNLVVCGKITTGSLSQILLLKTDDQGNVIWEKEYGEVYLTEQGNAIELNEDGSYIITGGSEEQHSGQNGIVLLKVDQSGNQLVLKDFGHSYNDYGMNIIKDTNDDNIITGQYSGYIFLTRTDNNCVFK
jgi:outer membrane protein assembly factor BamB